MTRITKAARRLRPEFATTDVYDWLRSMKPGLMLDVGAAAGSKCVKMLAASPHSSVIAFEPFPGNHRFLDAVGSDPRIKVIKKAVSSHSRGAKFLVGSTVTNGTGNWQGMDGYSSGGHIVQRTGERETLHVETCRLDDVVDGPVRFLKIDVQGHEFSVLKGAQELFNHGIELALIEFQGDARIVQFLAERGYALLDTDYHTTRGTFDLERWRLLGSVTLSSGRQAQTAVPLNAPGDPDSYAAWFREERKHYGSLWTDLIAIAPSSELLRPRSVLLRSLDWLRA